MHQTLNARMHRTKVSLVPRAKIDPTAQTGRTLPRRYRTEYRQLKRIYHPLIHIQGVGAGGVARRAHQVIGVRIFRLNIRGCIHLSQLRSTYYLPPYFSPSVNLSIFKWSLSNLSVIKPSIEARWESGYPTVCNTVYTSSSLVRASRLPTGTPVVLGEPIASVQSTRSFHEPL